MPKTTGEMILWHPRPSRSATASPESDDHSSPHASRPSFQILYDASPASQPEENSLCVLGYSVEFKLDADLAYRTIAFTQKPQRIYVTSDGDITIHSIWFEDGGGTIEFDLKDGELMHMDSYGCDFSTSGDVLFIRPHEPGGDRLKRGRPDFVGPRNSMEIFLAALPASSAPT